MTRRSVATILLGLALVASGCARGGEAPPTAEGKEVLACQVTDSGGIDDKSFNATAWAGMQRAERELRAQAQFLESRQQADYERNINAFLDKECDLVVTVGFLLGDATKAAATANPDQKFAIVDFAYDPPIDNVLALTFSTDEGAFLAGYLAAGMTRTGKVGTFGGIKIPTVTIFMEGFAAGIQHHNSKKGTSVQLLGWDPAKKEGLFTGDFTNQDNGRRVAETLMDQGADILLPVAGPVGLGAAAAVQDRGKATMIGVDTDQFVSAPEYAKLWLTSILKNMDVAVFDAVKAVREETFKGGTYVGTLKNEGVDIAPFHDFDSQVPAALKAELQQIKKDVIDGKLTVKPA